ncbi:hypothetical protein PN441_06295 [Spirulina major CS-329]|uniref:hypothetical protein n=1 Tax=Spirulina TaxID=1154 RepID=UPI00232B7313|nr:MULTISPECIES: hypothetical protein [Spirulina]MDB9496464.1 hypothetical protein [Spirulina subsalsa CS-330]MDB9502678.1 hypothetical protein [Spirulina major CS-329]
MKTSAVQPISWVLGLIYGLLLVMIAWLAYTDNLPDYLGRIPHYDLIGHFFLYFMATYLGHRMLRGRRITLWGWRIPLFPLVFGIITVVDECTQALSPVRTFSGLDLLMSLIGLAVGYGLAERARDR